MIRNLLLFLFGYGLLSCFPPAQGTHHIGPNLPAKVNASEYYLFYFHGAVVTTLGDNAINSGAPEWGPYEFSKILDSLAARGFNVVSERRMPDIPETAYVEKLTAQIDTLIQAGVPENHILAIGASAGWNIVVRAAAQLRNPQLKFVIMGGCWPNTYKDYEDLDLRGDFLSIIEATDPHGTCIKLSETHKDMSTFKEIQLNTGLSHGFIYKGYPEWIDPIMKWSGH